MTIAFDTHGRERVAAQYAQAANLEARINLHRRHSTSLVPWTRFAFDQIFELAPRGTPALRILEVGAGSGQLWADNSARIPAGWRIDFTDASAGMVEKAETVLATHAAQIRFRVVEANALPFADASFDVVVANHMLYHVPDRAGALEGFRRVLKPGGRFICATNGKRHLFEMYSAEVDAILYPDGKSETAIYQGEGSQDWFTLEQGFGEIQGVFGHAALIPFNDGLRVCDLDDLIAYHRSYTAVDAAVERGLRQYYENRRDAAGVVNITKSAGILTAVK